MGGDTWPGRLRAGGGGDVRAAAAIDLAPLWLVAVPLSFLTGIVLRLDIVWFCVSMMMEPVVKSTIGLWRLRSRKWIHDVTRIGEHIKTA